jgi:hypothetical protein
VFIGISLLIRVVRSFKNHFRSSTKLLGHLGFNGPGIRILFLCGSNSSLVKMENQFPGFSSLKLSLSWRLKQNNELFLNRKRLFYTRCGTFGVNYSNSRQLYPEIVKISPVAKPRGDHIKSSGYNIEQPLVITGQWSPSSSEDG